MLTDTRVARFALNVALLSAPGPVSLAAASPCSEPEHRRLDFWAGDWDTYEADARDKVVARARVDVILGGCALRETYEGADGLVGQSFTIYDASRKVWHQSWVTNKGQLLQIEGRFQGDRLTLQGPQVSPEAQATLVRGVWSPEAGGVRETAHTSKDGGATWQPLFDIFFKRRDAGATPVASDAERAAVETLTQLNREYVEAFMKADVNWYREHLADDFVCIESSGAVLDRDAFLLDAAKGPDVTQYDLADVRVRVLGDFALIHATGRFKRRDGTQGMSRYTDAYALRDGRWKAVAAQITRSREPGR